ncbi:MAG TPA: hypothetical protein EYH40_05330 [Desulfurococcales archaeon]|nr:hypothetical protein [Desulfurococcales archaeon]
MKSKSSDNNTTLMFIKEIYLTCLSEGKNGIKRFIKNLRTGERVKKALKAVSEKRVVRVILPSNTDIWFFNGKDSTHLIIPFKYCSCMDFLIHTVTKFTTPACYHLIAQAIAKALNNYRTLRLNEGEVISIINEINMRNLSITLKRKIKESERNS